MMAVRIPPDDGPPQIRFLSISPLFGSGIDSVDVLPDSVSDNSSAMGTEAIQFHAKENDSHMKTVLKDYFNKSYEKNCLCHGRQLFHPLKDL